MGGRALRSACAGDPPGGDPASCVPHRSRRSRRWRRTGAPTRAAVRRPGGAARAPSAAPSSGWRGRSRPAGSRREPAPSATVSVASRSGGVSTITSVSSACSRASNSCLRGDAEQLGRFRRDGTGREHEQAVIARNGPRQPPVALAGHERREPGVVRHSEDVVDTRKAHVAVDDNRAFSICAVEHREIGGRLGLPVSRACRRDRDAPGAVGRREEHSRAQRPIRLGSRRRRLLEHHHARIRGSVGGIVPSTGTSAPASRTRSCCVRIESSRSSSNNAASTPSNSPTPRPMSMACRSVMVPDLVGVDPASSTSTFGPASATWARSSGSRSRSTRICVVNDVIWLARAGVGRPPAC